MLLRTSDNVRADDLRIDLGGHFEIKIEVGIFHPDHWTWGPEFRHGLTILAQE